MQYLRDIDGVVHCSGAIAVGEFTLCGLSRDGENGDAVMAEVAGPITCYNCIWTIRHCKTIQRRQMKD
jgi:hypothetical protein